MKTNKKKSEVAADPKPATNTDALLLNIGQVATKLNMSIGSVRKLVDQGRIRRLPNYRHVLIHRSAIEQFAATAMAV